MKRLLPLLLVVILFSFVASVDRDDQGARASAAPLATGSIVLVARDLIDLKWDPSQYNNPNNEAFLRWELWRGTSSEDINQRIRVGFDTYTDFYRDEGLALNETYYYLLKVVRFDAVKEVEVSYTFFTASSSTGFFQGTVYKDLVLGAGTYDMAGYVGYKYPSSTGVVVTNNATLSIDVGTTVNRPDASKAYILCADKARIEIDGANFKDISVYFGFPDGDFSWGSGWVLNASGVDVGIFGESKDIDVMNSNDTGVILEHSGSALIENNTGVSSIWLQDLSSAVIVSNTITFSLRLEDQASAVIQDKNKIKGILDVYDAARAEIYGNYLYSRITVSGYGSHDERNAHAVIIGNTIETPYKNEGIFVSYDASAIIKQNTIKWTGYHEGESSILLSVSDDQTRVTAERNHIINGKILIYGGAAITVTENVLAGDGSAITVGCPVCGSVNQAKGTITKNTIQNGWGFELWAGSETKDLSIKHNCIRGNSPGLMVDDLFMSDKVNMTENWWGHIDGPYHPTLNPSGPGDPIDGYKVLIYPWDKTDVNCSDVPDKPPPEPALLFVEADPDELIPDGKSTSWVYAKIRDEYGDPVVGTEISFTLSPDLGELLNKTCVSGYDGQCRVQYQAPDPDDMKGEESVTVEAKGGNLTKTDDISFKYLKVENGLPVNGTRNVDWESASVYAYFDREIDPGSVNSNNFLITSLQYYQDGIPCRYDTSVSRHVWCWLDDMKDPQKYPDADIGLFIKAKLLGGSKGIHGSDGTFLRQDYVWTFYTTPKLSPKIIPVQVSEDAPLLADRPTVVRIHAGLDEFTELDWVEGYVKIQYNNGAMGTYERQKVRFYPGEAGEGSALLIGNSANFYSRDKEVPIVALGQSGTYELNAFVEPVDQISYPSTGPRKFSTSKSISVRNIQAEVWPFEYHLYPVSPEFYPPTWKPEYPWKVGDKIAGLENSQIVKSGRFYLDKLFPLRDIKFKPHYTVLETSSPINNVSFLDWHFLSGWLRRLDTVYANLQHAVMVVPKEWMIQANSNDPIFQGSSNFVCLMAEDASAAAIPQCIGHLYGLRYDQPSAPILRGYDLSRDRYVNSQFVAEYNLPVMSTLLLRKAADPVWIDKSNYNELVGEFTDLSLMNQPLGIDPSLDSLTATGLMMIGGEILIENGSESGLLDIALLPSTGSRILAPEGSGDYELQFINSSNEILSTHSFDPNFSTYEGDTDYASFLFNLTVSPETRKVKLLHGSVGLDTHIASNNVPQITVTQPATGPYTGEINVKWSASDSDGSAELQFSVLYSQDGGLTWGPISLWTTGESISLDTTEFTNCQNCVVKVIVNDGFHSAEATSAAFSVSNPPTLTWKWPYEGALDVGCLTEVVAVFRDAMNASSIGASSFTVKDYWGSPVPGTVEYDETLQEAVFTPNEALYYGRTYTANLDGGIKDALGQSLSSDYEWTFRVELGPYPVYLPIVFGQ